MNNLYISDLDGTLLNEKAELSEYTKTTLNQLISNGMNFSIATARTSATALPIMKDVLLNIPVVLMNGVIIYDVVNKKIMKTEYINQKSLMNILTSLQKYRQTGFLYYSENEELATVYEDLEAEHRKQFHDERVMKYRKKFEQVTSFFDCIEKPVIYISLNEKKELIEPVYQDLLKDTNLHLEFYRDVYRDEFWYLEICSANASKYNAIQYIRALYGYDKVISFGDNLNDISMFKASNESYAVANAKDEVKENATKVIIRNTEDGVARFLLEKFSHV